MIASKQLAVFPEHEQVIKEREACADLGIDVRMMVQTEEVSDDFRLGWVEGVVQYERLIRFRIDPSLDVVAGRVR